VSSLTIRGATALVGPELEPLRDATIVVRDGVIDSLDGTNAVGTVLDADGCFALPGLTDAHVHLDLEGGVDVIGGWLADRAERERVVFRNGLRSLAGGITSVRDVGCFDYTTLHYAGLVRSGEVVGPSVAACGRMIMRPGGHACEAGRVADGPAELREAAREQIRAGAGVVKVMASGGFSTPGDVHEAELTADELRAVVEEARVASVPVAAHAHATAAIANCLEVGIDTIEHGAFLAPAQAEEMATRGIPLVPTLRAIDVAVPGSAMEPDVVQAVEDSRERYESSIRLAIAAGVPIAAGTDGGTPLNEHGRLVDELEHYVELGMRPLDALRAATSRAGRLVGARLGAIEPGAPADMIVVEADPREDVGALRELRHVVRGGNPIDLDWVRSVLADSAGHHAIQRRREPA
jgi:imidazolonepropionase-like amidohydrolase